MFSKLARTRYYISDSAVAVLAKFVGRRNRMINGTFFLPEPEQEVNFVIMADWLINSNISLLQTYCVNKVDV